MTRRILLFDPDRLSLEQQIARLRQLAPDDVKAIQEIIADALRRRSPITGWDPPRGRRRSRRPWPE